jgi:hypothetical protein
MKHIKRFNQIDKANENILLGGLAFAGIMAGIAALPAAYRWAKNFWSKNVTGSKYKLTGRTEKIVTKLPKDISPVVLLKQSQRDAGEVVTDLKEYEDALGNKFWGWEHLYAEGDFYDYQQYLTYADMYVALYKEEDLPELKKFLENSERFTGKGRLSKPNPIEMIYSSEGPSYKGGTHGVG